MAADPYTGLPFDSDDQRALAYWIHVAVLMSNQAIMQAQLCAEGTPALQVYDDWDAIMRTDQRLDGGSEPVDYHSPRWNNTASL
jgi:hypothetical protein